MNVTQTSLVIIGANTPEAKVFWNGAEVLGVRSIRAHNDEDEARVHIRVTGDQDALYVEMIDAGIIVKKVTV